MSRHLQLLWGEQWRREGTESVFFSFFEPKLDLRQRPADDTWQIAEYIQDAVHQLSEPARIAVVQSRPMHSLAAPQIVLTLSSAPPMARSLPIDLRRVGGMVHTIEVPLHCGHEVIWAALRDKGIDLLHHWEVAHAEGHLVFRDQAGRAVTEWSASDAELEWAELFATSILWQSRVIPYGSAEAAAGASGPSSTTTTTSEGAGSNFAQRGPPTLLGAFPPVSTCPALGLSGIQVLPAHLISPNLQAVPAEAPCLYDLMEANTDGSRPYCLLAGQSTYHQAAGAHWPMRRFLQEAVSVSEHAARQVQFLHLPMPGLPTPQFLVTSVDDPRHAALYPVDARDIGGPICTIAIHEGEHCDDIIASLAQALPDLSSVLQLLLSQDAVFLQDATGQVWDGCSTSSPLTSWLALRCDRSRLAQAPPCVVAAVMPATTSTTTAAVAIHGHEPTITFVLAGGGLLLRSVPLQLSQVQVESVITDLVIALAVNGRLPSEPVISVATAMPRSAANPSHHMVGFIMTELADVDREVVVLHDPSLDGSLLSAVVVDRGTFIEAMVAPAQARRGFAAALNGAPQEGARRHLITGDFIQIYQRPLAARTWPVTHLYNILPALRLFALPVRLSGARNFMGRLTSDVARGQVRHELLQVVQLRMLEQALDLGEPGPGGYPVVVVGPTHVPLMVYVPESQPSHEGTTRFLMFSGLFAPGTTYAATSALSGTVPIVVSIPPQDHLLTVLYPTPDTSTAWLQLSVGPDVALHTLGLPVRRGMELIFPPRLTHATVLHERVASGSSRPTRRDPADMSLLQVQAHMKRAPRHPEPAAAQAIPSTVSSKVSRCPAPNQSASAIVVPTPLGRRRLARVSDCEQPACAQSGCEPPTVPKPPAEAVRVDRLPVSRSLNIDAALSPPNDDQGLRQSVHLLRAPWRNFWRGDLCSLPGLPTCFLNALRHCAPALGTVQHVHLFTDGSFIAGSPGAKCGWGICAVFEGLYQQQHAFAFAGFAGGPLETFLQRPVGALNTSYFAETAAAVVAVAWQLSLPACVPVTLWYDCQAVGGVINGHIAPKAGQGCLSLAGRLRSVVHLVESVRGSPCQATWLPSHAGNPFNELADCVAKAGAKLQIGDGGLAAPLWSLLQSPLLQWAWMLPGRDTSMPLLTDLLQGKYEERDQPSVECVVQPHPEPSRPTVARLAIKIVSCNVQTLRGKKPLVAQQLVDRKISIAGLQETRLSQNSEINGAAFFEFFSASSCGEGGCALLFSRQVPYAWQGLQPLFFHLRAFFASAPRSPR